MNREEAFTHFKVLQENFIIHKDLIFEANEAEVRLIVIDRILSLLGWEKEEFSPEAFCNTAGYADYILTTERSSRLVVEAKKVGVTFGFPTTTLTS
ncbi:TPA: hypothetical protein U5E44_004084, partial [Yersinia enterocolitica]|nr:hypothetical protein [Yersinia enterocolitica]